MKAKPFPRAIAALLLGIAATVSAAPVPAPVAEIAARAKIQGAIVASCTAIFRANRAPGFAIAVSSAKTGGRYLVIESERRVFELASYTGKPDLACYTRAEAVKLNASIAASETIEGSIAPLFGTAVVCAFLEQTAATCWQYSPKANTFVKVGSWVT
jgi:hypothetical protein